MTSLHTVKFELTNQHSVDGKNCGVLTSRRFCALRFDFCVISEVYTVEVRFMSAFSSNLPLPLLQFIKRHTCLQLSGLDEQPGSIQNFFLQRDTSLTGLECEGGGKSFPLVLLNIIFHKKLYLPFTLLGLVYHTDVRLLSSSELRRVQSVFCPCKDLRSLHTCFHRVLHVWF